MQKNKRSQSESKLLLADVSKWNCWDYISWSRGWGTWVTRKSQKELGLPEEGWLGRSDNLLPYQGGCSEGWLWRFLAGWWESTVNLNRGVFSRWRWQWCSWAWEQSAQCRCSSLPMGLFRTQLENSALWCEFSVASVLGRRSGKVSCGPFQPVILWYQV